MDGKNMQLIGEIKKFLPNIVYSHFIYMELFAESGVILFWMLKNFPKVKNKIINDINQDIIDTCKTIAYKPKDIISILEILQFTRR